MKQGDIVRVELTVQGFGVFKWEDEIVAEPEIGYYHLKSVDITVAKQYISDSHAIIPEGTRVEMWKAGIEDRAYMGWYISYSRATGKHLVSTIKNKTEGRQEWDCVRRIDTEIIDKIIGKTP